MMEPVFAILWTALVLYILFETGAVHAYLDTWIFVPFEFITKMTEYKRSTVASGSCDMTYSDYMSAYHPGFFVSLFSCRYCLGVWVALLFTILFGCFLWFPVVYFVGLLVSVLFGAMMEKVVGDE